MLRDPLRYGVFAGVAAFLLTCLSGHPLLIPEVAYPFWIALGLAVGAANTLSEAAAREDALREVPAAVPGRCGSMVPGVLTRRWLVTALVVFLFASIPGRVSREIQEVDLTRVTYGFHGWEQDRAGTRFRWTVRRARLHVSEQAQFIELPLRGRVENPGRSVDVDILLDGRPTRRVLLRDNSWQVVRVNIPPRDLPFRHVELRVSQTFVPGNSIPGSRDTRELGVQVGEVTVGEER